MLVSARGPSGVRLVADDAGVGDGSRSARTARSSSTSRATRSSRHRPLPSEIAAEVVRALRARLPDVCFATEIESRFALEPAFEGAWDGWQLPPGTQFADALELVTAPVTKLIARDVTRSTDELARSRPRS